ncbi:CYFA0S24e01508g1_1 [Cyberlindnera fabianii]|uniref:CYFA0S24e01508g1_1 n=1 Tax=Cyberlindnera fabianii TaxID=36022 RepID=A0A061BBC3_CYBFA|nr:CYFA0S24e01508g1_1 [Cyberlindnera fabianii]
MSTLEPQTSAKVRLTTTKGPIDIELWARETPVTSRIFLTHVLNSHFTGWEFNRVVKDFLVQIDGQLTQEPFEDEFNNRIRYNHRGMLGCVNLGSRNTNTGKFFITTREAPELQNKNTAFGKVVGNGIFTVLKIAEGDIGDDGETPVYPVKVTACEVLVPFFDDLVKEVTPIVEEKVVEKQPLKKKKKKAKVKLSLDDGDQDSEDGISVRMKSAHDLLKDKSLSKQSTPPIVAPEPEQQHEQEVSLNTIQEPQSTSGPTEPSRKEHLENIQAQIESLKSDLQDNFTKKTSTSDEPQRESALDKQRNDFLAKNPCLKASSKLSKDGREEETLKLLQSFQEKITSKTGTKETTTPTPNQESSSKTSNMDDDFDNLDDSDSDSDIYSHALRFDDNDANKAMANEDLLITIDESKKSTLRRKRDDDFYSSVVATSILSKKAKK